MSTKGKKIDARPIAHHRGRTSAQDAALRRDEYRCQWHLVVLDSIRPGNHAHHLFRPRSLYDEEQYIVSLCPECHSGLRHTKGALTDQMLIEQVMIPYIWNGEDLTPILLPGGRRHIGPEAEKTPTSRMADHKEIERIFDL